MSAKQGRGSGSPEARRRAAESQSKQEVVRANAPSYDASEGHRAASLADYEVYSPEHIGEAIYQLRSALHLSQLTMALRAGMDASYLASVERGRCNISVAKLISLCYVMGISMSKFFYLLEEQDRGQGSYRFRRPAYDSSQAHALRYHVLCEAADDEDEPLL